MTAGGLAAPLLWFLLGLPTFGQAPPAPAQAAQFDPSDVYFQGYLATRAAEQLEAKGDFIGATEKLQKAAEMFGAVRKYYPDWKATMVDGRVGKTTETLARVRSQAEAQLRKNRNAVAELEGGLKKSGRVAESADQVVPSKPGILTADPLATRRLAEAEAEVQRLRQQAAKAAAEVEDLRQRKQTATTTEAAEVQRLRQQTAAAEAQVAALQQNKQTANTEAAAEVLRLRQQTAAGEAQVEASRQLKQAASEKAAAEVLRLRQQTATAEAEVAALKQNKQAANSQAAAEVQRLRQQVAKAEAEVAASRQRKLTADTEAAAEVQRLRQQAAKAEAEVETLRLRKQSANAATEAELQRLRQQAIKAEAEIAASRANKQATNAASDAELQRLRQQAAKADENSREASRNNSRLLDVARQRDALQAQLHAAETDVAALRARLATAPMEKEMKDLNQRIETLDQEREAMAMALTQSRGAHTAAMSQIATLQADLQVIQQQHADLNRNLKAERNVANSVVAGQRRQLDVLEKELAKKDGQLGKANERIGGLLTELQESRAAFAQLRTERDSLLQERDQMTALLKLNEAGRIQDLIEQNMALAKNLREANDKVDRISRESNADQDATTAALRDLAIAKSQINRLHQDKRDQDKRLADLESRLQAEEHALAQNQVAAVDPAEVEVLRDIIKRQLRVQERRRQARDLLVDAAKELGSKDERLAKAIDLFDAQEIALSPDEQKLIANKQVDGEFVSPFARDRTTVGQATAELTRDIAVFERTAEKSFIAGRLLPTRELYQMILEQHPGHTPSLCKLGVVQLRLDEPTAAVDTFRRAVELDSNNPYAARMLGFALMQLGDLPAAEQVVRRSVDLAPNDAKSQMLLATLCYRLGHAGEAESYFKAAISADPVPSEPYYNLALLCSRDRRLEDAKNYYQQALERGALPDPALEQRLAKP